MAALKKKRSFGAGSNWSADMSRLFDEGHYSTAADLYEGHARGPTPPVDASFLRARIFMRKPGEGYRAVSLLNRLRTSKSSPEYVRLQMFLGEAYAVTGDARAADSHLDSAMKTAETLKDTELVAAVAYRIGRRHALTGSEPQIAREWLQVARRGQTTEAKLNALHLESWILSREARSRDQARVLMELLRSLEVRDPEHMEHRIRATQTLAALARELYIPEAVPVVERQLQLVEWPSDFAIARFQTTKALAWSKALQGDYFNAFRFLKQSATVAPDPAWRTMAFCDRAYLASVRKQDLWFRQELSDAEESAALVDWESREDESIIALLLLAELLAPLNAAQASEYAARFHSISDVKNPHSLIRRDSRLEALVNFSTGVVDLRLGERKLGISRIQSAMKAYEQAGFEWRAARAAIQLYDATRKSATLDVAENWLRHYSASWLAEELRARRHSGPSVPELTPMRERVFRLLCEGKSNAEIAALLGISVATVANHAKAVLKAFSVSSRHALLAEAARRGLTPAR
jgi:DNA-binding CsgD family transcriptional regulator